MKSSNLEVSHPFQKCLMQKQARLVNLHATIAALYSFIIKSLDQLPNHNLKLSLYEANIVDLMLKEVIIRYGVSRLTVRASSALLLSLTARTSSMMLAKTIRCLYSQSEGWWLGKSHVVGT